MTGVLFSFFSFCKLCSFGCVCLVIEAGLVIFYLKKKVKCSVQMDNTLAARMYALFLRSEKSTSDGLVLGPKGPLDGCR